MMQNLIMRTTVNLDDETYALASAYAAAREITLGSALGELVRTARKPPSTPSIPKFQIGPNGLPILPSRGRKLTPEIVKALSEDELG
jgi:hypothetical protein